MQGAHIFQDVLGSRLRSIYTLNQSYRTFNARSQHVFSSLRTRALPEGFFAHCRMFPIAGDGGPSWPQLYLTAVGSAALGAIGTRAWEAWRGRRPVYNGPKRQKLNDDPAQPPTPDASVDKVIEGPQTTATAPTAPETTTASVPAEGLPSEAPQSDVGHSNSAVDLQKLQELEQRVCAVRLPLAGPVSMIAWESS